MVYNLWQPLDGDLYKAMNPTPGTGIAQSIIGAFSATDGVLSLRNAAVEVEPARKKIIMPLYLRLIPTVVPASGVRSEGLIAVDSITRYSSGGSAITNLRNPVMNNPEVSSAVVHFGALTFAAESANVRRVERFQLRSVIPVAFEELLIQFAGQLYGYDTATGTLGGTVALRCPVTVAPVVLYPGHSMTVHLWHPSNAATPASWEFTLAYREKLA